MRRNSVRLLKLFIGALVLVVLGPTVIRRITGRSESNSIEPRLRPINHIPMGLPVDPDTFAKHVDGVEEDKPQPQAQVVIPPNQVKFCCLKGLIVIMYGFSCRHRQRPSSGSLINQLKYWKLDDSAQNRFGPFRFCNHRSSAYVSSHVPNQPYLQWVPVSYIGRIVRPACEAT